MFAIFSPPQAIILLVHYSPSINTLLLHIYYHTRELPQNPPETTTPNARQVNTLLIPTPAPPLLIMSEPTDGERKVCSYQGRTRILWTEEEDSFIINSREATERPVSYESIALELLGRTCDACRIRYNILRGANLTTDQATILTQLWVLYVV